MKKFTTSSDVTFVFVGAAALCMWAAFAALAYALGYLMALSTWGFCVIAVALCAWIAIASHQETRAVRATISSLATAFAVHAISVPIIAFACLLAATVEMMYGESFGPSARRKAQREIEAGL